MRQIASLFLMMLSSLTVSAQELSFYEMTASDVNLRERPTAQSRKLVEGEVVPEFSNSGYTYHLPKGSVVYAIKQQGEWTQIYANYCPDSWVMTKFLKKIEHQPIGSLKELRKYDPLASLRTQDPYAGFALGMQGGEFDEELFLQILVNNALVTIDEIAGSCVDVNEVGGNSYAPLKIVKDEYGSLTVRYSKRHTSEGEYGEDFDLDKLSKEEMEMLLNLFPITKADIKNAKPISATYFFSGQDEYGNGRSVTLPTEYLKGK